jgi:hypothetical protein
MRNWILLFYLFISCVVSISGQELSSPRRPVIPMLKDGSVAAYVLFTQPKQTRGLALAAPEGSGVQGDVFMGHRGAMPADDSQDKALYFQTAADEVVLATGTFYLTIEYSDRGQGSIEVDYQKQIDETKTEIQTERIFLRNSALWQQHTFLLRDAILNRGFVGDSDFRIRCPGVAMRAVWLSRMPPANPPRAVLQQMFRQPEIVAPTGYEFGIFLQESLQGEIWRDAEVMKKKVKLYKAWGAQYLVDTINAASLGRESWGYDFSSYAKRVEQAASHGMVWTPRIVIGDLSRLPQSVGGRLQRAMGTHRESEGPMASVWDAQLPEIYAGILQDLRRQVFEKRLTRIVLSFAGDWGPLLLSSDNLQTVGWPDLWAGDPLAEANFREHLQRRYGRLNAVNAAWRTPFKNWNEATPKLESDANAARRADTRAWYRFGLSQMAAHLLKRLQGMFPGTQIVLEIGDEFDFGATDVRDFAELAARESCSLLMATSSANPTTLSMWQLLSSSCRRRGVQFGLRLTRKADENGMLGAMYALASERGNLFFFEEDDLAGENAWESYGKSVAQLRFTQPQRQLAVIFPRTSINEASLDEWERCVREMRELFAFDVIDELDLTGISSTQYPLIFVPWGNVWSSEAILAMENLARSGAALAARSDGAWRTPAGEVDFNERLFAAKLTRQGNAWGLEPRRTNLTPDDKTDPFVAAERRVIDLGAQSDAPFLAGDWGAPQNKAAASRYGFDFPSFRWLGERGQATLPIVPGRDYDLIVEGYIPKDNKCQLFVDGRQFGVIEGNGKFQFNQPLAGRWRPKRRDVAVTFRGQKWNPGEVLGATETFQVSLAVSRMALLPPGEELDAVENTAVMLREPDFTRQSLRGSWLREVGKGVTLLAPTDFMNDWVFLELLNNLAANPTLLSPRYSFSLPPDGKTNQVFVSPHAGGAVYLNLSDKPEAVGDRRMGTMRMIPAKSLYYSN